MKKIAAIVLVGATVLSLAACSKKSAKKISSADFKSKLEAEGYSIMENEDVADEDIKESVGAYSEDMSVMLTYSLYKEKDTAKKMFDTMKSLAELGKSQEGVKVSTSSSKVSIQEDESYSVFIIAEDMIITATAQPGSDDKVKEADSALKALGF